MQIDRSQSIHTQAIIRIDTFTVHSETHYHTIPGAGLVRRRFNTSTHMVCHQRYNLPSNTMRIERAPCRARVCVCLCVCTWCVHTMRPIQSQRKVFRGQVLRCGDVCVRAMRFDRIYYTHTCRERPVRISSPCAVRICDQHVVRRHRDTGETAHTCSRQHLGACRLLPGTCARARLINWLITRAHTLSCTIISYTERR